MFAYRENQRIQVLSDSKVQAGTEYKMELKEISAK